MKPEQNIIPREQGTLTAQDHINIQLIGTIVDTVNIKLTDLSSRPSETEDHQSMKIFSGCAELGSLYSKLE